jgi:hypothetical protein
MRINNIINDILSCQILSLANYHDKEKQDSFRSWSGMGYGDLKDVDRQRVSVNAPRCEEINSSFTEIVSWLYTLKAMVYRIKKGNVDWTVNFLFHPWIFCVTWITFMLIKTHKTGYMSSYGILQLERLYAYLINYPPSSTWLHFCSSREHFQTKQQDSVITFELSCMRAWILSMRWSTLWRFLLHLFSFNKVVGVLAFNEQGKCWPQSLPWV